MMQGQGPMPGYGPGYAPPMEMNPMGVYSPQQIMPPAVLPGGGSPAFPETTVADNQPTPQNLTCKHCKGQVLTAMTKTLSGVGCCMVILLCLLFFPLMWLPCCYECCHQYNHICPNCKGDLTYRA